MTITSQSDNNRPRGRQTVKRVKGKALPPGPRVKREGFGRKTFSAKVGQQFTIGADITVSITERERDGRLHVTVEAPLTVFVSDLVPTAG